MWSFFASSSIVCNNHHFWVPRVWGSRGRTLSAKLLFLITQVGDIFTQQPVVLIQVWGWISGKGTEPGKGGGLSCGPGSCRDRICAVIVPYHGSKKGTVYADVRMSCHFPSQSMWPSWLCVVPRPPCCFFFLFRTTAWIITVCHMKQLQEGLDSSIKRCFFLFFFHSSIQHPRVLQRSLIAHNDTSDFHIISAFLGLGQQQEVKKKDN